MYLQNRKRVPLALLIIAAAALLVFTTDGVGANQPRYAETSQALSEINSDPIEKQTTIPIIPGLSGWGVRSFGGSGRHLTPPSTRIMMVTNLMDRGTGTLRACVEAAEPRTCVFEVGGVIALSRDLKIKSPYITIAGQTAPHPGISLINAGVRVATHNVLIQHIAIRPGDSGEGSPPQERDAISIGTPPPYMARNVVLDHVSLTWAVDENLSTVYELTRDVTVANSIIAEGLYDSIHPKGPHSKGVLIGDHSKRISLQRNLLAHNEERNPYIKPGTQVEFVNNIVYGWGPRGPWALCNLTNNEEFDAPILLNFIGNVYRAGPTSAEGAPVYAKRMSAASKIYLKDNLGQPRAMTSPLSSPIASLPSNIHPVIRPLPSLSSQTSILPSSKVIDVVLPSVGSRPFFRAPPDERIVTNVRERRGGLKNCTAKCSTATGTINNTRGSFRRLKLPLSPRAIEGNGYTQLESWLHAYARHVETGEAEPR